MRNYAFLLMNSPAILTRTLFILTSDFDDSRPTDFHTEMEKQMGI